MKNKLAGFTSLFLALLLPSVAAQNNFVEFMKGIFTGAIDFVYKLMFGNWIADIALGQLLLLLLAIVLLYNPAKKLTGDSAGLGFLVSFAVSLIGMRLVPPTVLQAIFLNYSAVAVTVTTVVPIILLFIFFKQSEIPVPMKRFGWALFAVALIGLWWSRRELVDNKLVTLIYLGGGILSLIFALVERITVNYQDMESATTGIARGRIRALLNKIDELRQSIISDPGHADTYRKDIANLKRELNNLKKEAYPPLPTWMKVALGVLVFIFISYLIYMIVGA